MGQEQNSPFESNIKHCCILERWTGEIQAACFSKVCLRLPITKLVPKTFKLDRYVQHLDWSFTWNKGSSRQRSAQVALANCVTLWCKLESFVEIFQWMAELSFYQQKLWSHSCFKKLIYFTNISRLQNHRGKMEINVRWVKDSTLLI